MADGLLLWWYAAMAGYLVGMVAHLVRAAQDRGYLPRAKYPAIVHGWIFDELNRAATKLLLLCWGLARLALVTERPADAVSNLAIMHVDLLTLVIYWLLLLQLTHWTWRVRSRRVVVWRE